MGEQFRHLVQSFLGARRNSDETFRLDMRDLVPRLNEALVQANRTLVQREHAYDKAWRAQDLQMYEAIAK